MLCLSNLQIKAEMSPPREKDELLLEAGVPYTHT